MEQTQQEPQVSQTSSEPPKEVKAMAKQLVELSQSKEKDESPTIEKKEAGPKGSRIVEEPGGSVNEGGSVVVEETTTDEPETGYQGWRGVAVTIYESLDLKNKVPATWQREVKNFWEKNLASHYEAYVEKIILPIVWSKAFLGCFCIFYGGCFPRIATAFFATELSGTSNFLLAVDTFLMTLPIGKGFKAVFSDILSRKNGPQDINSLLGNFAVQFAILSFALSTPSAQAMCLGICISMMIQAYHSSELAPFFEDHKVTQFGEKFNIKIEKQWMEFIFVHGLAWLFFFIAYFAPVFVTSLAVGIYGANLYKMEAIYSYLMLFIGVAWQVWSNYSIGMVTSVLLWPIFAVDRMI